MTETEVARLERRLERERRVRKEAEAIAEAATSESVRLDANKALLDRGWGRPKETTEVTGPEGGPLEFIVRQIMEGSKPPRK